MFPIRDGNPHSLPPVATYAIIAANVAVWVGVQGLGSEPSLSGSICRLGLIPGELLSTLPTGPQLGAVDDAICPNAGSGWYTAVTSMFLHGSWMHILSNMWFMWVFGNNAEDAMGLLRFLLFYLLCGLAETGASHPPLASRSVRLAGQLG